MKQRFYKGIKFYVLILGPFLSIVLLPDIFGKFLLSGEDSLFAFAILCMWSPLYFSIPAIIMQKSRDNFRPNSVGLINNTKRALLIVPGIIMRGGAPGREMGFSVIGFIIGTLFTVYYYPLI
jgi:hypothetical protein